MTAILNSPTVVEESPFSADRLLAAVPLRVRGEVERLLLNPRHGGRGLRQWLSSLETDWRPLPRQLPLELVEIYLKDDDAEPLHDCERCGLLVPVRVARRVGHEPTVERIYFPSCPNCSGRTGRFAYWSSRA
jgi:hypothetical protein